MPDGTEFFVGTFKVDAPAITPVVPTISPTSGTNGDAFVISDPEGRMAGATIIVFFAQGQGPEQGTFAQGIKFSVT